MPKVQSTISFQKLRSLCELFQWRDKRYGLMTEGFNPPAGAQDVKRVPFSITYVTKKGKLEHGYCVCVRVDRRKKMRLLQYVESGEYRWVYDFLVIEVKGMRVVVH